MTSPAGRALGPIAVLAFASLGLPDGVLGVAWPAMRQSFGQPVSGVGLVLAAAMLGTILSGFGTGPLVARLGVGRLLVASSLLTAASALGTALTPAWWGAVVAGLFAGLGGGAIDAGINVFAAARFTPRLTSWLHASYGVGATAGPLLTSAVVARAGSWRAAYAVVGLALLAMSGLFLATAGRWRGPDGPRSPAGRAASLGGALRQPRVWRGAATFFVYAGLEVGAGLWAFSWLSEGRGLAGPEASAWVAGFWGSLTAGRLLAGALTRRWPSHAVLRGAIAGVPAGILVLWGGIGPAAGAAGLVLLGLTLAPIYPLLVAETPGQVGAPLAAHAIGLQVAAFYLGTAVLPGAAGVLARHGGLELLGPYFLVTALALVGLHWPRA
jgi:fucose permease